MFKKPENSITQFHVDPGMVVVDIGSGIGHYTLPIAKAVGDSGKVYAVEVQQDLLKKLKSEATNQKLSNIDFIWGDIEEENGTKLVDKVADRVLISNTLFQVRDREAVIRESKRILKDKGRILVIDWKESYGGIGPKPADIVEKEEVVDMLKRHGFGLDREIKWRNRGERS